MDRLWYLKKTFGMMNREVDRVRVWTLLFVVATLLLTGCSDRPETQVREIRLVTKQFDYDPPVIRIKQGERVRLVVESEDVIHGFGILEWHINRQVLPGEATVIDLQPDKVGEFQIVCTVFCGTGHAYHKGMIVVEGR